MRILVPNDMLDALKPRLLEIDPNLQVAGMTTEGPVDSSCTDAEAFLWGGFSRQAVAHLLPHLPCLRWIHTLGAGVEYVLTPELVQSPVLLTNSAGVYAIPIAEHVLAMILAVARRIPAFVEQQHRHEWRKVKAEEVLGKILLIIGTGHIGQEVARRAKGLEMQVLGLRSHPQPTPFVDEIFSIDHLHDLLPRADYVAITAPLTAATNGLFGEAELHAMKPSAWLINIARGRIVQQKVLLHALQEGWIGGACLDVFVEEPLPADSPFWDLPNAIISPHNSWSSPRVDERRTALFLENVRRFTAGEPLLNVVDKRRGY